MDINKPIESLVLPKWLLQSHRYYAEQHVFLQNFPACKEGPWLQSPYSVEHDGWYFVYMTNRSQGRYSYVFEKKPEKKEIYDYPIHMGYTALLILKKKRFFQGDSNLGFSDNVLGIERCWNAALGNCLLLQDPLVKGQNHNDVLLIGDERTCTQTASDLRDRFGCTLLVAEVVMDENWH